MSKEEILSEYFLVETEKTDEIQGWKVIGKIDGCAFQSVSPLLEFKTDREGWLCDFKIKLLHCGLVLGSPEYMINEDDLVMEAVEKIWKEWGVYQSLLNTLDPQTLEDWNKVVGPYTEKETWITQVTPDYSSTTYPITYTNTKSWTTDKLTCLDSTANYQSAKCSNYSSLLGLEY